MKKLLSMLSMLTLASTSIGTTISTNTNNNTKISNNSKYYSDVKYIKSPIGNHPFLKAKGNWMMEEKEWAYTTLNIGPVKHEKLLSIRSTSLDTYTEHKVASYNYHYKDSKEAGFNHGWNLRNCLFKGKITDDWTYADAVANAYVNFQSETSWGLANHWAIGTEPLNFCEIIIIITS